MIKNECFHFERSAHDDPRSFLKAVEERIGPRALRWYITEITERGVTVEASIFEGELASFSEDAKERAYPGKSVALSIIPTGVGCSIGGYAGDAAPATNLLAGTVDYLITHPNAVNASNFVSFDDNILYTEGFSIDLFCKGLVNLYVPYGNKVGVVIDKSDDQSLDTVFNVINAVRAVHGVDIIDYVITDEPVMGRCVKNKSGAFVGSVDNLPIVLDACRKLVERGANALAITSNVQDLPPADYAKHFAGLCPNPVGGVEALISHIVTNQFQVPAAHAPLINIKPEGMEHNVVDARGAGEMASASGLACVLIGLRRAPQIRREAGGGVRDIVNVNNLLAVVVPASCLGGIPTIYAQKYGLPIIAVHDNQTILDVTRAKLQFEKVVEVRNYAEAAGVIMALKRGISLESITRPLKTLRH